MALQYCIQCTDKQSGQVGDFLHHGDFLAVSPVFNNLADFFRYLKGEGLKAGNNFEVVPI